MPPPNLQKRPLRRLRVPHRPVPLHILAHGRFHVHDGGGVGALGEAVELALEGRQAVGVVAEGGGDGGGDRDGRIAFTRGA